MATSFSDALFEVLRRNQVAEQQRLTRLDRNVARSEDVGFRERQFEFQQEEAEANRDERLLERQRRESRENLQDMLKALELTAAGVIEPAGAAPSVQDLTDPIKVKGVEGIAEIDDKTPASESSQAFEFGGGRFQLVPREVRARREARSEAQKIAARNSGELLGKLQVLEVLSPGAVEQLQGDSAAVSEIIFNTRRPGVNDVIVKGLQAKHPDDPEAQLNELWANEARLRQISSSNRALSPRDLVFLNSLQDTGQLLRTGNLSLTGDPELDQGLALIRVDLQTRVGQGEMTQEEADRRLGAVTDRVRDIKPNRKKDLLELMMNNLGDIEAKDINQLGVETKDSN